MSREALLAEFDGSVCPACHHRAHDPGGCSECPRCELHTDEALAFVLRIEPELVADDALASIYGQLVDRLWGCDKDANEVLDLFESRP